jgi:formylglycine-generating enzyme required for sulfatase activity
MERYYNQYLRVPAGVYLVGSPAPSGEELAEQHIKLESFYMGKFPITNALFEIFIDGTGYKTTAEKCGYSTVYQGRFQKITDRTGRCKSVWRAASTPETINKANWFQPFGPGSTLHKKRNHPVVHVSLNDAMAFSAWIGKKIPAEYEWEAGVRTDLGNVFPWGDRWQDNICNTEEAGIADTAAVDRHVAGENALGIACTLGNVLEWTADSCEPRFHLSSRTTFFIAKGGSWISDQTIRPYSRFRFEKDFTANILGFRSIAD